MTPIFQRLCGAWDKLFVRVRLTVAILGGAELGAVVVVRSKPQTNKLCHLSCRTVPYCVVSLAFSSSFFVSDFTSHLAFHVFTPSL